jgi:hypothetical protein
MGLLFEVKQGYDSEKVSKALASAFFVVEDITFSDQLLTNCDLLAAILVTIFR